MALLNHQDCANAVDAGAQRRVDVVYLLVRTSTGVSWYLSEGWVADGNNLPPLFGTTDIPNDCIPFAINADANAFKNNPAVVPPSCKIERVSQAPLRR
jgi:hypothetical protein